MGARRNPPARDPEARVAPVRRPAASVLLDAGILYAYYDRSDDWHARALGVLRQEAGGLVVPAPVIPEVDHLLVRRLGPKAQQVFYRALADGDYIVADLPHDRFERVADLNRRFAELAIGFVDAAIVAIGEVTGVRRLATTDRRHFAVVASALAWELLP